MDYVLIDPDVIKTIQSDTARCPYSECAGLLLGAWRNETEPTRIVRSYGDGPSSESTVSSVSPDVNYFNKLIRAAEKDGLEFLGEWHKHPGSFSYPSSGDVSTIEEIMKLNNLQMYVAMIITGFGEQIEIHPYLFKLVASYDKILHRTQSLPTKHSSLEMTTPHETELRKEVMETDQGEIASKGSEEKPDVSFPTSFAGAVERIRAWFLRGGSFSQRKDVPPEENKRADPIPSIPWYESEAGKTALLLEKKSMNQHFPDFALFKKDRMLFWSGAHEGIKIIIAYPENYPTRPIIIELRPSLQKLSNERECFYATIAAQIAYLRIKSQDEMQGSKSMDER